MLRKKSNRILAFLMLAAMLCTLLPTPAFAVGTAGSLSTVYLSGSGDDDINDGTSITTPVKTFAEAKRLLSATDGTIYITGTVAVSDTETWSLDGYTNAIVQRGSGFVNALVSVSSGGSLTLSDIIIDGNKSAVPANQPLISVSTGSLNMENGAVLQNNKASNKAGAVAISASSTFTMNGGTITNNETTASANNVGGGINVNASSFIMNGGEISNNKSPSGGGIYITSTNDTEINGGSIVNNTITTGKGSAICIANNPSITPKIAPAATITGSIYFNSTSSYLSIPGALTNPLTVEGAAPAEGLVVAKGSSGYTLTTSDCDKFSYNGGGWYFALNTANNEIHLTQMQGPVTIYTVTTDTNMPHATLAVNPASGPAGTTVTVTVTILHSAYRMVANSLKYTADDGSTYTVINASAGVYSFILPAADVFVTAQFELIPFDVTVDSPISGGSITVNPESGTAGDIITVSVTPDEGKQLVADSLIMKATDLHWQGSITATEGVYSFTLPASNVTVTAQFEDSSAATYTITTDSAISGGSVSVNPVSGSTGDTITVSVTPIDGKQLVANSLKYTTDGGNTYTAISAIGGVYSFPLPAANVTVTAQFEDSSAATYTITTDSAISGGSVSVNPVSGSTGATVTVSVAPGEGKQLVANSLKYTTDGGSTYTVISAIGGVYSFPLPAANVVVTAQFESIPAATYTVMADNAISGGGVSMNPTSGFAGALITVSVTPGDGKQLVANSLKYTANGGSTYTAISASGGVYSFPLPAANVTVTAQFENSSATTYSITKAAVPDPIWTVTTDKTSAAAGETVTVTVADTAFTSWATGLVVTGLSGTHYSFTTVTPATGNANNVNGAGVYSFVMPAESVSVNFTADYTTLDVYTQIGSGSETLVHSYTRAEMDALATVNTSPKYYTVYDRLPATFMGKAVRYVTIQQLADSARAYNSGVRFNGEGCVLKSNSMDGWTNNLTWEYLAGPTRKYYAALGDQYLAPENRTGVDREVPAVLAITGWAGRKTSVDNQPYDTLNAYRFFYGQSAEEYGNGILPTTNAEKDVRCTANNSAKFVNKVVFVVPTYTVTTDSAISGGTLAVNPASGPAGTAVTVSVTPGNGKQLVANSLKYTVDGGSTYTAISASGGVYTFPLPAANVIVSARFENIPVGAYAVTTDSAITGGIIGVSPASGTAGTVVMVTVTPGNGKQLVANSLKYTSDGGRTYTAISVSGGVYSFPLPAANVLVTAQFENIPAGIYTVTPVEDSSVYTVGTTADGLSTMTVKSGITGQKYFGVGIVPVVKHEGQEAIVFVHLHDGIMVNLKVTKADFDVVNQAQASFNVEPGDIIKEFVVDNLTNDLNFNPTVFQ